MAFPQPWGQGDLGQPSSGAPCRFYPKPACRLLSHEVGGGASGCPALAPSGVCCHGMNLECILNVKDRALWTVLGVFASLWVLSSHAGGDPVLLVVVTQPRFRAVTEGWGGLGSRGPRVLRTNGRPRGCWKEGCA